jgi:hypothetical protein
MAQKKKAPYDPTHQTPAQNDVPLNTSKEATQRREWVKKAGDGDLQRELRSRDADRLSGKDSHGKRKSTK